MMISIDQVLAQQIVNTIKDVCGENINFISPNGIILASTDDKRINTYHEIGHKAASTGTIIEVNTDYDFIGTQKGINMPIYHNHTLISVIGISGNPDEVRKYATLAERITHLLIHERELNAYSKNQEEKKNFIIQSFISNQTVNQTYLIDCLKEFKINLHTKKRIVLIHTTPKYNPINLPMLDQEIKNLFQMIFQNLYTFNYPNEYLAVIDSSSYTSNLFIFQKFAADYQKILKIAVGKECGIHCLSDSYYSAVTAWKSIADTQENLAAFDDLTLEIILSNLNGTTKEEFCAKILSNLSSEELHLLYVYFEKDMSLAACSNQLFLHKNTVQHKLNRIFEKCGLNPRRFRDAVLLYLALKLN